MRRGIILLVGAALAASMAVPVSAAGSPQVPSGFTVDQAVEVVQDAGVEASEAEIRAAIDDAVTAAKAGRAHGCRTVWAHFWLTVCYYVLAPYPPGTNGVIVCFDNLCVPVFLPVVTRG